MNVTPGHYQSTCGCSVQYITNDEAQEQIEGICTMVGICKPKMSDIVFNPLLRLAAKIDFNK
jgi:hypothetical protein